MDELCRRGGHQESEKGVLYACEYEDRNKRSGKTLCYIGLHEVGWIFET